MAGVPDPIGKSPAGHPLRAFLEIVVEEGLGGPLAAKLYSAARRLNDFEPLLRTIGRRGVFTAKNAIMGQTSPDGRAFAPLKKPRGKGHNPGTKALFDTGNLYNSIDYRVDPDSVAIGFGMFYGKFHQEGTKHIPARPFLGLGQADTDAIAGFTEVFVGRAFGAGGEDFAEAAGP